MLSLYPEQLKLLKDTQTHQSSHNDPFYLSPKLVDSLDGIQTYLMTEAKLWSLPKSIYLDSSASTDTVMHPRSVVIPEAKDTVELGRL